MKKLILSMLLLLLQAVAYASTPAVNLVIVNTNTPLAITVLSTNGFGLGQVLGMALNGSGFVALTQSGGAQTNLALVIGSSTATVTAVTNSSVTTHTISQTSAQAQTAIGAGVYDASGAALNATNGLTSALLQAKIGASIYAPYGALALWLGDVDAAGFSLNNLNSLSATGGLNVASATFTNSNFLTAPHMSLANSTNAAGYAGAGLNDTTNAAAAGWPAGRVTYVPLTGDIQTYVTAATAGDTLILGSGTYTLTAPIIITKQVNVVGQGSMGLATAPVTAGHGTLITSTTAAMKAFEVQYDNVRISDISINLTGAGSIGVNVSSNRVGVVLKNLDIIVKSTGANQGIAVQGSDAIVKDVTFYITSLDSTAQGLNFWNNAVCTTNNTLSAFNISGTVSNGATSAYSYIINDGSATKTLTCNMFHCTGTTIGNSGTRVGIACTSSAAAISTVNAYLCTFYGLTYDALQSGANVLALGGSVIVQNLVSGTPTYRATVVAGSFAGLGSTETNAAGFYLAGLNDATNAAAASTNALGSAAYHATGDYDASGAALNATNGLTSSLLSAKIGAGVYDASGAALNATNGLTTAQLQAQIGGSVYDASGAALNSTNGLSGATIVAKVGAGVYDASGAALNATNGQSAAQLVAQISTTPVARATGDASGNAIASTYLLLTGGNGTNETFWGDQYHTNKTFTDSSGWWNTNLGAASLAVNVSKGVVKAYQGFETIPTYTWTAASNGTNFNVAFGGRLNVLQTTNMYLSAAANTDDNYQDFVAHIKGAGFQVNFGFVTNLYGAYSTNTVTIGASNGPWILTIDRFTNGTCSAVLIPPNN